MTHETADITVSVPEGLSRSDAEYWLRHRSAIIETLTAQGLSIVSNAGGVAVMRAGAPRTMQPTYYVAHPDGSYSVADPQPVAQSTKVAPEAADLSDDAALMACDAWEIGKQVWPSGGPSLIEQSRFANLIERKLRDRMGQSKPPAQHKGGA